MQTQSSLALTPDNYTAIINDFINIADSEMRTGGLFEQSTTPAAAVSIMSLLLNTNAWGVMSKEFTSAVVEKYATDDEFRRILGSIAIRFEVVLNLKYGIPRNTFTSKLMSIIDVSKDPDTEESMTHLGILDDRISGFNDATKRLSHVNDFWLICLILMRFNFDSFGTYYGMVEEHKALLATTPVLKKKAPSVPSSTV